MGDGDAGGGVRGRLGTAICATAVEPSLGEAGAFFFIAFSLLRSWIDLLHWSTAGVGPHLAAPGSRRASR